MRNSVFFEAFGFVFVLLRLWGKVLGGEGVPSGFWETSGIFGNASDFVLAFAPGVTVYILLFFFLLFLRAAAGRTQKSPRRFWAKLWGS